MAASPELNKTSTVIKQFVVDYTTATFEPLTEHEVGGLDYRYVYGNDRLSVNITGVGTSSGNLVENGNQIRLYYHMDYLGTADYLTSPVTGKVTSWTHYNEWGEITHNAVLKTGQRELDLVKRYATHDYDAVLNMYYAKARMYDAENRRFASVDPVKGNIADPMTMVQYLYVVDNPLRYIDPLGKRATNLNYGAKLRVKSTIGLNLRTSYSTNAGKLYAMPDGQIVTFQGADYDDINNGRTWVKVRDDNTGVEGWCDYAWLELVNVPPQSTLNTPSKPANLAASNSQNVVKPSGQDVTPARPVPSQSPVSDPDPEPSQRKDFNPINSSSGGDQSNNPPEGLRLVGFGLQLEFSGIVVQPISGGFELVIYIDEYVVKNSNKWYTSSLYFYAGGTISSDDLLSIVQNLASNPSAVANRSLLGQMVPAGLQGSLCVFAIWGNETFRDPTDYAGPFKSISGTFKHIKGFVAECSSCVAIGVGYDTQLVGCGFSKTMYWTLVEHVDDVFDELARTLQGIVENAKGQFSGNF